MQGEKIRDLDTCLEHHRDKLNATEELLQQVASIAPTQPGAERHSEETRGYGFITVSAYKVKTDRRGVTRELQ